MSAHDLINAEPWVSEAACGGIVDPYSDPETFFPLIEGPRATERHPDDVDRAKAICGRCKVAEPCLTFAITNDERYGIWGGTTAHERAKIKRRRAHA